MFHHFCDEKHPRGQGAITADELAAMIRHIGRENIIDAEEFGVRATSGTLANNQVCLTFDDALLCQYDVARPVLDDFKIRAFWFVYSSVFEGGSEPLEIYRYFRTVAFDDIEQFYSAFFKLAQSDEILAKFDHTQYLIDDPFYTPNDKRFRFLRDDVLGEKRYFALMDAMILESNFSIPEIKALLWMNDHHLKQLSQDGHVVGLHSYRHPTRLSALPISAQRDEYARNSAHVTTVTSITPWAVSHPCNSYSDDTLGILSSLGVKLGFRAYPDVEPGRSRLELPRIDHAIVMKEMS